MLVQRKAVLTKYFVRKGLIIKLVNQFIIENSVSKKKKILTFFNNRFSKLSRCLGTLYKSLYKISKECMVYLQSSLSPQIHRPLQR